MNAVETAEKLRAYIWAAMEVMERHNDRPDIVETGKEKIETLLAAEEAVKKQIRKEAQHEYDDEFICPSCGKATEDYDVTTYKFCPECGQALKW